jgi:hypothetical protein
MNTPYQTTELEVAAFLKARGHRLLDAQPQGRLVTFGFEDSACEDVQAYFSGAEVSARELFEAHRHLRALIQQLKQHSYQQIGKDNHEGTRTRSQ